MVTLARSTFDLAEPTNIRYDASTKTLELDSLTLKQKIAQMVIVYGNDESRREWQKMAVGGIFLEAKPSAKDFQKSIEKYQESSLIPFLVTADVEGCRNPFESFKTFPTFKEIQTVQEAYNVGFSAGKTMRELGFNMNFAPVVDLEDTIWGCRSFSGTAEEISVKTAAYVDGLSTQGILSVAKHYPGKTLCVSDTHLVGGQAEIESQDLLPFQTAMNEGVSGIMISHLIVNGAINSQGKPGVVSPTLVQDLKNEFTGLIITDEIGMLGLRDYYTNAQGQTNYKQMFLDLFQTENDLILTFDRNPEHVYGMISVIEEAVKKGEISEERIDSSVRKIMKAKGITLI